MAHPTLAPDRGVSAVVGVLLMLAITVVLAGILGTLALNLNEGTGDVGPTAQLGATDADETYDDTDASFQNFLTVSHETGDALPGHDVRFVLRNASTNAVIARWEEGGWAANGSVSLRTRLNGDTLTTDDEIGPSDEIVISVKPDGSNQPAAGNSYVLQVVHPPSDMELLSESIDVQ